MEQQLNKRLPLADRLLNGLKEANEWARGERDDLRVTVVKLPDEESQLSPKEPATKPVS